MTTTALAIVAAMNVLVLVVVLFLVGRLASRVRRMQAGVADLAVQDPSLLKVADAIVVGKPRIITLEILNPVEVATGKTKLAGFASAVAPNLINKIVYEQTLPILQKHLSDYGVKADVRIHVGD